MVSKEVEMAKKDNKAQFGKIAFVVGLLLAVIAGVVPQVQAYAYTALILVVLGLVVGFINVAEKNVLSLLIAIIALVMIGNAALGVNPISLKYLVPILNNFVAFVGAAGLVVALKVALATTKA